MNVNLDVLELVFAHLQGSDLVASSLVSRSFLAGVIPTLYARISYTASHAKRPQLTSPFTTLCTHKHLCVHVKHVAVHSVPSLPYSQHQVDPAFLKDLTQALAESGNLRSFTCTVAGILAPLLPALKEKGGLTHLRANGSLGTRQVKLLQEVKGLRSLCLDFPSWHVIDVLPKWISSMNSSLIHLTIFMSQEIDGSILNATLEHLPRLQGLHIINCLKVTHSVLLRALSHTPDLRELSLTIFPSPPVPTPLVPGTVPPLTHLSLDIRTTHPSVRSLIANLVERLAPRQGLAICGSWTGDITSELEDRTSAYRGGGAGDNGLGGGASGAHGQAQFNVNGAPTYFPLLTPGNPPNVHANVPVQPFGYLAPGASPNGNASYTNDNSNPANANASGSTASNPFPNGPNAHQGFGHGASPAADPLPSLISTLPQTLTSLHLPSVSQQALSEIVARCEGLRVLGLGLGAGFSVLSPRSRGSGSVGSRGSSMASSSSVVRGLGHSGNIGVWSMSGSVRPEIRTLAAILSHARDLRVLILDTSLLHSTRMGADGSRVPGDTGGTDGRNGNGRAGGGNSSGKGGTLLSAAAVRGLINEAPRLKRVVGEGRIWRVPDIPPCTSREAALILSPSRPVSFTGSSHGHGSPSFSMSGSAVGGGYGQVEDSRSGNGSDGHEGAGDGHWFWLNGTKEEA